MGLTKLLKFRNDGRWDWTTVPIIDSVALYRTITVVSGHFVKLDCPGCSWFQALLWSKPIIGCNLQHMWPACQPNTWSHSSHQRETHSPTPRQITHRVRWGRCRGENQPELPASLPPRISRPNYYSKFAKDHTMFIMEQSWDGSRPETHWKHETPLPGCDCITCVTHKLLTVVAAGNWTVWDIFMTWSNVLKPPFLGLLLWRQNIW